MRVFARRIPTDWPLTLPALLLCAIGVAMVYSAGRTDVPTAATHAWRAQLVWIGLALSAAWIVSRISMRLIEWIAVPLYALAVFLLILVLVPGFGTGAGPAASVKGWLTIAGHRIGQPAEFAKLALVLMLAKVLATG
ncbi:MAG TPA: FtsW/RodA/SpoVE family cell cycle protein, partial [Gemmatimonadaceae bacterium]|nr:FtsW/RodA/SpoVE family cell cycle protein [Gemmatimonadaceae bacterium]